jgi:NAD(P)-dependent dehydrogenase (short-subunit alcohol dehydrogenase family)
MQLSQARHAFITGGASGLGLGIADALAADGLKVTLADIDEAALSRVLGERSDAYRGQPLDTRDRAAWARAKAEAEAAFGAVDILVNNAGIAPIGAELVDEDPATFDLVIAINLIGVFNGVAAFAPDMRKRGRGHIVNTASMAGLMVNAPGYGSYAVAKFGVVAMSEQLRLELAPHGVGVSALCPGYVPTNILRNSVKLSGGVGVEPPILPPAEIDARAVGAIVADAIQRDLPYILTHPSSWPVVESRQDAVREAFERAAAARN